MSDFERDFYIEKLCNFVVMQNEKIKSFLNGSTDCFEAVFVNSGKLNVTVGENIYECPQGTAIIVPPNVMHFIKLKENVYAEYTAVSFFAKGEMCNEFGALITPLSVFQKQLVLSISNLISASCGYNKAISGSGEISDLELLKLIAATELTVLETYSNNEYIANIDSRDAAIFKTAVEKMQKNVLGKTSAEEMANELSISLSHLKRIFALFTDVGAHEYFMQLKIIKAKEMLKSGVSVTETAEKTGFNNQNYFSAAFKRIAGVSPKEYGGVKLKKFDAPKPTKLVQKEAAKPKTESAADMPSYLL